MSGDVTAGSKLALFSNDSSRLAYPTAEAVSKSEYTNSSLNASSPWWWWLADAYASSSCNVRGVYSSGAMDWYVAYSGNYGVRPLCNLSSGILVSDSPDSDGAYTIIWNRAPSKPSSITVPSVSYTHLDVYKRQQMFSGTKIGGAFSKIGGAAGGVFSKLFSGMGGVATRAFTGVAGTITNILGKAGTAVTAGPLGKICLLYTSRCV